MKFHSIISASMLSGSLILGHAVLAQAPAGRPPGMRSEFGFRPGKLVTGAPYAAEVSNSSVRTLADGNTIQRNMTGRVARDNAGRTFSTETITGLFGQAGSKTITFISDPVAGYSYTLNEETKMAVRRPFHATAAAKHEGAARKQKPGFETEDLGLQSIDGVLARGTKVTHTIPAGEMGNAQPIVSVNESWLSPDLKIMVSAKRMDPREGTSTYALNNIQRGEPSATLFQVPPDYTVKDAPSFERSQTPPPPAP